MSDLVHASLRIEYDITLGTFEDVFRIMVLSSCQQTTLIREESKTCSIAFFVLNSRSHLGHSTMLWLVL